MGWWIFIERICKVWFIEGNGPSMHGPKNVFKSCWPVKYCWPT